MFINKLKGTCKQKMWMETCACFHPFPCLVFEERFDDGVHGMNVPRLIHKMDSSKPSGKTVLRREESRSPEQPVIAGESFVTPLNVFIYLKAFDRQFEDVGGELGGLFEGEVAPVDDEDEAVDLELRVLYQNLQREQDRPQDVRERVPDRGGGGGGD